MEAGTGTGLSKDEELGPSASKRTSLTSFRISSLRAAASERLSKNGSVRGGSRSSRVAAAAELPVNSRGSTFSPASSMGHGVNMQVEPGPLAEGYEDLQVDWQGPSTGTSAPDLDHLHAMHGPGGGFMGPGPVGEGTEGPSQDGHGSGAETSGSRPSEGRGSERLSALKKLTTSLADLAAAGASTAGKVAASGGSMASMVGLVGGPGGSRHAHHQSNLSNTGQEGPEGSAQAEEGASVRGGTHKPKGERRLSAMLLGDPAALLRKGTSTPGGALDQPPSHAGTGVSTGQREAPTLPKGTGLFMAATHLVSGLQAR